MSRLHRRDFLKNSSAAGFAAAALLAGRQAAKAWAGERVRVGVVGAAGRALCLNRHFAANANAEIVVIADIDSSHFGQAVADVTKLQGKAPCAR